MSKKTILIIEDERDMAELMAMRLKKEGYAVELAHEGKDGLRMARSVKPDLVLLDLMLPGMSGNEIAQELRNDPRTTGIPIIMVTAKSEDSDVVVGLHLGADDYVTKPFSMSVLVARTEAVLRRSDSQSGNGKTSISIGPIRIDQDRHQAELNDQPLSLTLTEFRLLSALAAARGRVLTRNQLIDQAIGVDAVVTDRTIDVHLTSLRRKLGNARKFLKTVRGVGYRIAADDDENEN
jgi:two-component system phosphate regulon response regulator PhoB